MRIIHQKLRRLRHDGRRAALLTVRQAQVHDQNGTNPLIQQQLANDELQTIEIHIDDLEAYFRKDDEKGLLDGFRNNTLRYLAVFEDIIDRLLPLRNVEYNPLNVPPF